ncbi:MAG: hypothetical protein WA666_00875 [Nitrospirota bacterium]
MAAIKEAGKNHFARNVIIFILGILGSGAVSVWLGQCVDYDLLNYHYYNAYSFLNHRLNFDYGLANIQGYFNPLPDLPLYLLITHLKPIWAGFFMGAIEGVSFWIIFAISYHILFELKPASRLVLSVSAAITGFLGPFNLSELGASMNDNTVGIFVLLSILFILKSMPAEEAPDTFKKNMVIFSGAVMGIAGGLKLTALTYAVGAALAFLALSVSWKEKIRTGALWAASAAAGFIAVAGYWMFVLWEKFRNPFFPLYNKIFKSPYYYPINFQDIRFSPHELHKWLLLPFYFLSNSGGVAERPFRDMRLALVFVFGAAALLFYAFGRFNKKPGQAATPAALDNSRRYLLGFFLFSFIVWEKMFCVYRYAVPIEVISPVMLIILVFFLFRSEKIRVYSLLVLFAAAILFAKAPDWGRGGWSDSFLHVSVPEIEAENALVIMPFSPRETPSYLAPFFPGSVRFLRLESWLTKPEDDGSKFQEEMKGVLNGHSGPEYLLSRDPETDNELLKKYYRRAISDPNGQLVTGYTGEYGLFRLSRF